MTDLCQCGCDRVNGWEPGQGRRLVWASQHHRVSRVRGVELQLSERQGQRWLNTQVHISVDCFKNKWIELWKCTLPVAMFTRIYWNPTDQSPHYSYASVFFIIKMQSCLFLITFWDLTFIAVCKKMYFILEHFFSWIIFLFFIKSLPNIYEL